MTNEEILLKFEKVFPFADVDDYRPIGKEGITVWLKNGDIIDYYPNKESEVEE